jgi:hypothetical protein
MPSTGNDPSAAAGFSFPDADGGGGGDSEDGDFADTHQLLDPTGPSLPNPTTRRTRRSGLVRCIAGSHYTRFQFKLVVFFINRRPP